MADDGMTQSEIATILGVHQTAVSAYLCNRDSHVARAARRGKRRCNECGGTANTMKPDEVRDLMLIGFEAGADLAVEAANVCTVDGIPGWSIVKWSPSSPALCRDCMCGEWSKRELDLLASSLGVY